jgi:hypothetical protein
VLPASDASKLIYAITTRYSIRRVNVSKMTCVNVLMPSGYLLITRFNIKKILHGAHIVCMCFVWISEQTATFALYISGLVFYITEVESVYCAVRNEAFYKTGASLL